MKYSYFLQTTRFRMIVQLVLTFGVCIPLYPQQLAYASSAEAQVENTKDMTTVLNDIKKTYGVNFIYEPHLVKGITVSSVNPKKSKKPLAKLLTNLLKPHGLTYDKISEKDYVIKRIEVKERSVLIEKNVEIEVSGQVVGAEDGLGIPGVTVLVKGTSNGTITDVEGNYKVNVPNGASILTFTYIGYKTQEVAVGTQTVINITLSEDSKLLTEVVVNALGFEVLTDKLGSATSTVKAEDMVRSGESSVINSLQGKMSGVSITRSNGDPGAGSNIRIRGANTIFGSTQPLIIIDGIPVSNSNTQGGGSSSTGNGTSQQSRLNDINPNDIETLQVLKGASAAALWGSRASNGVVIITTKSGQKGFKVNFRNALSIDEVNKIAPLQKNYGQGLSGRFRHGYLHGWGDEISSRAGGADDFDTSGEYFIGDQTGTRYYPIADGVAGGNLHGGKNSKETFLDENFDDVFRTGVLWEQSLSISAGDDKSSIFFSLGNTDHKGIIRNNDYTRYTTSLSASRKFNDFVSLKMKGKYARVEANRIQQNSNTAGLLLGYYRNISDFDITDFTGTYVSASGAETSGRHRSYRNPIGSSERPRYNNPLWTTDMQKAPNIVNRHIYTAELDFFPVEKLNIKLRGGVDTFSDKRTYLYPRGSARTGSIPRLEGNLTFENIGETELNFDAIARYEKQINQNINSTYVVGWNINDRKFNRETVVGSDFIVNDEIYTLDNSRIVQADNFIRHIRSNRGYSTANFELYDQLFVDLTGTIEVASTIKDPFFYPSVSAAWQLSNANFFPKDGVINFAKARLSWGKVGIQPSAYRSATNYEGDFTYSNGIFGNLSSTNHGGGFRLDNSLGNADLKPEIKTEIEAGLELRFFHNILSTSFTYYTNNIEDILLTLDTSPSGGFTSFYTNGASMENNGFEIEMSALLLEDVQDWRLTPFANFARNRNEVTDLAGADVQRLTGFGTGDGVAAEGFQMGALFGGKLPRADDGSVVLDANGFPEGTPEYDVIGDPNPDWSGGLGFELGFKNLSLNVLFEHSQGGDFYDITRQINTQRGFSEESGNKVTIPTGGVVDVDGNTYAAGEVVRGNLHDFGAGTVLLEQEWYRGNGAGNRGFSELWLQDATWTRLRELTLSYSLSQNILKKIKLSSVVLSMTGRNLFLWTDVIGNDPDKNFAGVGNSRGLDYYTNPSTKSYLFSLNITF